MKLNALVLGLAGAILAAICMLLLSLANYFGIYQTAALTMQEIHMFYSPDFWGTITGMIEAAIMSFVGLFVFGWLYNRFTK